MKNVILILVLLVAVISAKAFADQSLCQSIDNQISDANATLNAWGEKKAQLEAWKIDAGCVAVEPVVNAEVPEVIETPFIEPEQFDGVNW